jgi:hypothetical protein
MNERFLPGLSNEEARSKFAIIIQESVNASFAEVMELAHRLAVWAKY